VRDDGVMADVFKLRRVADGPHTIRSGLRRVRRYEVSDPTGEIRVVTLHQLDSLLQARAMPADFWACVDAADAAYTAGDRDVLIEWPTGRRSDRA
jgi:hypothetical protein